MKKESAAIYLYGGSEPQYSLLYPDKNQMQNVMNLNLQLLSVGDSTKVRNVSYSAERSMYKLQGRQILRHESDF